MDNCSAVKFCRRHSDETTNLTNPHLIQHPLSQHQGAFFTLSLAMQGLETCDSSRVLRRQTEIFNIDIGSLQPTLGKRIENNFVGVPPQPHCFLSVAIYS